MASLLERKLIVITGKGGTGKSTIAAALGLIAAGRGLRTIVAQVDGQGLLPALYGYGAEAGDGTGSADKDEDKNGHGNEGEDGDRNRDGARDGDRSTSGSESDEERARPEPGRIVALSESLSAVSIDPDAALFDWLRRAGGRIPAGVLSRSTSFQYLAAAAPGAKELTCMIEACELAERYDTVILDAPATGHALAMLDSPSTFTAIVRSGPLAGHALDVRELLADERRTAYVAVAHASELAMSETLELEEGLRLRLDRDLDAVVVNGVLPRRFTREELARIAPLGEEGVAERLGVEPALARSAARAARSIAERARLQQSQLARLRRQRFAHGAPPEVITVPLAFVTRIDLAALRRLAAGLGRKLS
jgi:anion-transporting  ArsA/GET3 family ATPase